MRTAQPFQQSFAGLPPCPPAPLERSVVALGRKTLIGAGAALCFLTAWASGATWYLISHDEIVARFLARQTEMQYAYEDRIAALRTHLDRVASQKLLEQDGFEGRVSDLITRQVQLETRQAVLTTLAERAGAPPMAGTARGLEPTFSPLPSSGGLSASAPKPAPESLGLRLREATPAVEAPRGRPRTSTPDVSKGHASERLSYIDQSISLVETAQMRALDSILRTAQARVSRIRTAVVEAGLNPDSLQTSGAAPMGGPLVLPAAHAKPDPFEKLAERASTSLIQLDHGRPGPHERLRYAGRSIHPRPRPAHRVRFPRRSWGSSARRRRGPGRQR